MFVGIRGNKFHADGVENFSDTQLPEMRSLPHRRFADILLCDKSLHCRVDISGSKFLSDTGKLWMYEFS